MAHVVSFANGSTKVVKSSHFVRFKNLDETLLSVWYVIGGGLFIALKPTHMGAELGRCGDELGRCGDELCRCGDEVGRCGDELSVW